MWLNPPVPVLRQVESAGRWHASHAGGKPAAAWLGAVVAANSRWWQLTQATEDARKTALRWQDSQAICR